MTRIHSCLQQEHIILSSETFDELDVASIRRLEALLLRHNKSPQEGKLQIRVVAVYRDWFQCLFSAYVERTKKSLSRLRSFSNFFTMRYDSAREGYGLDILGILRRYEEVFGLDALSLIDYAGTEAAGKDIAEQKRENESPPWKSYEVLVVVRDWAFRRGCSVNASIDNIQGLEKLASEYEGRIYEFPIRTSHLYPLRDLSDRIRRDFDDRYRLYTFYSNASADVLKRNSFMVELLDYDALFKNKSMLVELDNQVNNLMAREIKSILASDVIHEQNVIMGGRSLPSCCLLTFGQTNTHQTNTKKQSPFFSSLSTIGDVLPNGKLLKCSACQKSPLLVLSELLSLRKYI
eukprot:scaffold3255_cov191-Ochromonas_danica.AAC.3